MTHPILSYRTVFLLPITSYSTCPRSCYSSLLKTWPCVSIDTYSVLCWTFCNIIVTAFCFYGNRCSVEGFFSTARPRKFDLSVIVKRLRYARCISAILGNVGLFAFTFCHLCHGYGGERIQLGICPLS